MPSRIEAGRKSFLESAEWEEVQRRMGRRCTRIGGVLAIRHDLPLGHHYWYAPRPILDAPCLLALVEQARASGALFLKVDPATPLAPIPYRHALSHSLQPSETVFMDCRKSDTEFLAAMHPKTRYNIRLAERHGVTVRIPRPPILERDIQFFHGLLTETAARDGFRLHPAEHYRILFQVGSVPFMNALFLAELNGVPIAAALVNCYAPSRTATYLHGGSSRAHRALMAPHLLHWHVMRYLRETGFDRYDLGGIDERKWPGVSRFKLGFGGSRHVFPSSVDYIFRRMPYALYRLRRLLLRTA